MAAQIKKLILWKPLDNFPIDIETACSEEVVGALLAVYEHQQQYVMKGKDAPTSAHNFHQSVIAHPALYLSRLENNAQHHEEKLRRENRRVHHADMIDMLYGRLPREVPRCVPRIRQLASQRAYRAVRKHLQATYFAFQDEWKIQKGEKEPPESKTKLEGAVA